MHRGFTEILFLFKVMPVKTPMGQYMSASESNEIYVSTMGLNLRKLDPSFDSRTYGFKTLTQLFSKLRDFIIVDNIVNGLNNPLIRRK